MTSAEARNPLPGADLIDLVVIGGSAGAVQVLSQLALQLTDRFAPAMVVVVHMAQDARAMLPQILGAPGRPPMKQAEDKEPVSPGTVYFAAPGYHLLIEAERTFALSLDEPQHFSRPSIDVLFQSAADAYGPRVAGVILSGANTDGASGLRAIADAGGVTIVQDPETAEAATMPRAAWEACPNSHLIDRAELASWLGSLERRNP
ncbi:MAG TPA: chemotaxis protein CheB [Steroidobacteraceae bacterium]|nr:chemotaxis protein CheB [Steroidobacteraceae bacterium]